MPSTVTYMPMLNPTNYPVICMPFYKHTLYKFNNGWLVKFTIHLIKFSNGWPIKLMVEK